MLLLIAMAKHTPKRNYSLRKVTGIPKVTLGALVKLTAAIGALSGTSDAQYRLISADHTWALRDFTAGEGPIVVGYAFGDYTIAQIKAYLENSASISPGNKASQEIAGRWIRKVGTFAGAEVSETLNDGRPIKTRLNWAVPIGSTVNAFAYNSDDLQDLTTGGVVDLDGNLWVKDY